MERAIPAFSAPYLAMVAGLEDAGGTVEATFEVLSRLRSAIAAETERMEAVKDRSA
jgi:hypothetical protein